MDNDQSSKLDSKNSGSNPQADPVVDWTSYHEQNESPVDVGVMAALVRRVGGELQKIDSQSVSHSTQKAERIDKQKLIAELQGRGKESLPSSPPPPPQITTENSAPLTAPLKVPRKPQPPQYTQPILQNHDIEKLQKRLDRLESSTRLFRKTKKIKRGLAYKVSSNSVKGVIKDADLVAEFVISELAKGVKSITIKLDESTNT